MHNKKTHTLSLVFALLASAIFGMSFMFSKLALEVAKPTVLLAFRFLIAFTAMSLVILVNALVGKMRGKPLFAFSLRGKPIGSLVLLGLIQPVLYFFCENYGILYTSSAVAGTIIAVVPIACIVTDVLILHERVTRRQVICAVLCIGGVMLLYGAGRGKKGFGKVTGVVAAVYNGVTGFFSDILSYVRLMALMLSGAVLAQVFNMLGATTGNIVTFVIISLVGNTLNLALNLLGCYVHDMRLQFLEFFGRFYKDGGKAFRPLCMQSNYVEIVKEEHE